MENEDREYRLHVIPAPERFDRNTALAWIHDEAAGYLQVVNMGLLADDEEIRKAMMWLVNDLQTMVQACRDAIEEDRTLDLREVSMREMLDSGAFNAQALILSAQLFREGYSGLADCVLSALARAIARRLDELEKLIPREAA